MQQKKGRLENVDILVNRYILYVVQIAFIYGAFGLVW